MNYNPVRSLELLKVGSGKPDASFRDGQEEAIRHVVEGRGRLLVVQKTGWGKSFVYFIATKLLREAGAGPVLLVSPLLSLMRNQISAAERMGVRALTINSENVDDWENIEETVRRDEVDILLISPERLANERFQETVLGKVAGRVSMLVIDEAHCVSDWGHDFRPHYRLLGRMMKSMPANMRLLATTATANNRVMDDLQEILGPGLTVSRGDLSRPSLKLQTIHLKNQAERLAWLAETLPQIKGTGIIYTLTQRDSETVAAFLRTKGLNVEAYTAATGEARPELEQALLDNRVKALVATTALGMGYDKPDLRFVIHYQAPGSVVAYYQQVGRAGRAVEAAYGVMLCGEEDAEINEYFIKGAFPTREEAAKVLDALRDAPDGLGRWEIQKVVNLNWGRIQKTFDLLALESPSPIIYSDKRWRLTGTPLSEAFWERAERLTRLRREEHRQMQEYAALTDGHMQFLIGALDGDPSGIVTPSLPPLTDAVDPALVAEAEAFLKRSQVPIEPRVLWPGGGLPVYEVKGRIPDDLQGEPGRALCVWGNAGWGGAVLSGKYKDGRFGDDLVAACAKMAREWGPEPFPEWVTCIPSRRHPRLVPDFAERLAAALGLPFVMTLTKTDDRAEQKTMANSILQARNLDGSFAILDGRISPGPVFLVDDMVDSRWTMTVASWLLRKNGAGRVYPLALAWTGPGQ
jgi:ATP-dependent DNA helicase RecQ